MMGQEAWVRIRLDELVRLRFLEVSRRCEALSVILCRIWFYERVPAVVTLLLIRHERSEACDRCNFPKPCDTPRVHPQNVWQI